MCTQCGGETQNPKFCSKSCAAKFNNVNYPKRKLEGTCIKCGIPVTRRNKYCTPCRHPDLSLDFKTSSNRGKNPYARNQARKLYIASGRPLHCLICKYDRHVDVCHIRDVRTFPDGTLYTVINDQSNLIALCKNHHWEFDHGFL